MKYEHKPESKYEFLVCPADLRDCAGLGIDAGDLVCVDVSGEMSR